MLLIEVPLEVFDRELVVSFKLAVIFSILLNGIVGEVDVFDVKVVQVKSLGGGAQVAVIVEVTLQDAIDRSHHAESSNVKLSSINEEGSIDILL